MGPPFQAGFTDALGADLAETSVKTIRVGRGNFDAAIGAHHRRALGATRESAYAEGFERTLQVIESDARKGYAPEILARSILRAATLPRPATT